MPSDSRRATFAALAGLASLCLCACLPLTAAAQPAWPSFKPIRLIVAYPAGGVTDAVARLVSDRLGAQLGTSIVVDNRAGAAGLIGMDAVAKAAPDGYTFGISTVSTLTLTPHLNKMPFDPARDIAPVVSIAYSPVVMMATPIMPARDFRAVLADARSRPGAIRWSTSGQGSLGQIMLEQIKLAAHVDITHIPYRGSGQQFNDAMGGQLEMVSINASQTLLQQIRSGKLRPLAIGAAARMASLPDVPTLAELGFPQANRSSTLGAFAPARTPAPVIERLNAEINKILAQPDVRKLLLEMGNVPTGGTPAAFAQGIAAESADNARIIKAANIRLE